MISKDQSDSSLFKQVQSKKLNEIEIHCFGGDEILVGKRTTKMVTPKLCDISEVRPYLFLSGFGCITEKKLRDLGITHIVDATNLPNNPHYEGIEFLNVMVDDSLIANLTPYFGNVAQFISNAKKEGGKALIYCAAGISRSSSLCIMSLVLNEELSLREAYYEVLDKRPFISPNISFWRQMIDYELKERGQSTVELLRGMARPIPDVYIKKPRS